MRKSTCIYVYLEQYNAHHKGKFCICVCIAFGCRSKKHVALLNFGQSAKNRRTEAKAQQIDRQAISLAYTTWLNKVVYN